MELTKANIEKKLKELEQSRISAIANVNAIAGAMQVLSDLIKEEKPAEEKKNG